MKVYLGADHGGFALKEKVKTWLVDWKIEFEDKGAKTLDPADDYPQFAFSVGEAVSGTPDAKGILLCRSAAGMVIAANKVAGIRAVAVSDVRGATHAREHNNANIIGISGDWTDEEMTKHIIKAFLDTKFSNEPRHKRRVDQISAYESSCCGGCC